MIELLIVVAIIGILASMLLPALKNARDRARRALCMNNMRQCSISMVLYADDAKGQFPQTTVDSWVTLYLDYNNPGFNDIRLRLKKYLPSFQVWGCPTIHAPPITDSRNTANHHSNFLYWPYHTNNADFDSPGNVAKHSQRTLLIQDCTYLNPTPLWRTNHGVGGTITQYFAGNPSFQTFSGGYPIGFNVVYGDGHANWKQWGQGTAKVFTVNSGGAYDYYSDTDALQ